jgi:predicted RNase H-like nuclease (RuvC/YqgF family)
MHSLALDGESFSVPTRLLVANCRLFATNPDLHTKPYDVQSRVSVASFRDFLAAIGGSEVTITSDNVSDLGRLCGEFEFMDFAQKLDDWQPAHGAFATEMRGELRVLRAAMADQRLRHEREISDLEHNVELLRQANNAQREAQEREAQAVAVVQKVVGQLAGAVEALRSENRRERSAFGEVARANEQLRAEVAGLKQRIGLLEQENRRLSEANEVLNRAVGAFRTAPRR